MEKTSHELFLLQLRLQSAASSLIAVRSYARHSDIAPKVPRRSIIDSAYRHARARYPQFINDILQHWQLSSSLHRFSRPWTFASSLLPNLLFPSSFRRSSASVRSLMLQKKRRTSDCQNHKKQLIPQHRNTTTLSIAYLIERGIHSVKLGVLLDLGTTCCNQLCWPVARISYRPFFLPHERRSLPAHSAIPNHTPGTNFFDAASTPSAALHDRKRDLPG